MIRLNTVILLILIGTLAYSQRVSIALTMGGANYSGDMTSNLKDVIKQTSPAVGLNLQYQFDPYFTVKLGFENLKVRANDKLGSQEWQHTRDLNFKSSIRSYDLSGMFNLKNVLLPEKDFVNFSLVGGYTLFQFNPFTNFNGQTIELRPLGTEGQGMAGYNKKYSSWAGAINFGISVEYLINELWSIESQLLLRKTNTDYIDDLSTNYVDYDILAQQNGPLAAQLGNKIKAPQGSQRGNPIGNDWYHSLNFGIKYRISIKRYNNFRKSRKATVICPKFKK